jgi:hypothetical protein
VVFCEGEHFTRLKLHTLDAAVIGLWLADNLAVPLELEASYEETCAALRIV